MVSSRTGAETGSRRRGATVPLGTPYALPAGTHDGVPLQERQAWT